MNLIIEKKFFNSFINMSKKFLIVFLFLIHIQPSISVPIKSNKSEIKSVVLGHLYPIMRHNPKILEILFKKIKILDPDYIFILGDSELHKKNIINKWRKYFGNKVFFAPGNHEIVNGNLDEFIYNVGYKNTVVETPIVRFLVGNSNAHYSELVSFIEESNNNRTKKPNILLIHHRIWDDTMTSPRPYLHDKSFYLKDIFPTLEKYVSTIFAGNSKHQFFADMGKGISGKQNMNLIYWADRIGNINAYSVGIGLGRPKLGFVEVLSNKENEAIVIPHHIQTEFNDPLPINKLVLHPGSVPPAKIRSNKIVRNIESNYLDLKYKFKTSRFYIHYKKLRKNRKYFFYLFYFSLGAFFPSITKRIIGKINSKKIPNA